MLLLLFNLVHKERSLKVRALVLCALLFTAVSAYSQTTTPSAGASCPIKITDINPTGNDSFGHGFMSGNAHANDGRMFVLKVKNTSGKNIRGMKFQAAYYDATEDLNAIPGEWEWTDPVKAGAEKSFRWHNEWRAESQVGWKVTLTKVLFDDGSKWEPASGQDCSLEYWRHKKH